MAGGFHLYYEAARALWNLPLQRLEALASEAESPGRRRAAAATLRLKSDFMNPLEYGTERAAVTKLAAVLSEDPEFTMDMALNTANLSRKRPVKVLVQSGVAGRSRRSTRMWIAIIAGVVLLILDVLATAGAPVPTPIGDLIDLLTGSDEAPRTPAPPPP